MRYHRYLLANHYPVLLNDFSKSTDESEADQVIRHVVFFKFKPESSAEERKAALDALRDLPRKIDVIRQFEVGDNIIPSTRAWDAVLLALYDSLDALQEYSLHHEHVAVAGTLKAICADIGSVDYEEPPRD